MAVLSAIAIARKLIHRPVHIWPGMEKPQTTGARSAGLGAIVTGLQEGRIAPVEN
jgi:hypothetical protein